MTDEAKENLGQEIDRLDNIACGLVLPIPDKMHLDQLKIILPEIVENLKKQFVDLTGENPWD